MKSILFGRALEIILHNMIKYLMQICAYMFTHLILSKRFKHALTKFLAKD